MKQKGPKKCKNLKSCVIVQLTLFVIPPKNPKAKHAQHLTIHGAEGGKWSGGDPEQKIDVTKRKQERKTWSEREKV